jgi:hypothetical protein
MVDLGLPQAAAAVPEPKLFLLFASSGLGLLLLRGQRRVDRGDRCR